MTEEQVAEAVRDFEARYAAAFNRRDVAAFAELFTEGATVVTEWGDVVAGRAMSGNCRVGGRRPSLPRHGLHSTLKCNTQLFVNADLERLADISICNMQKQLGRGR
jgi:hypothetical protein